MDGCQDLGLSSGIVWVPTVISLPRSGAVSTDFHSEAVYAAVSKGEFSPYARFGVNESRPGGPKLT